MGEEKSRLQPRPPSVRRKTEQGGAAGVRRSRRGGSEESEQGGATGELVKLLSQLGYEPKLLLSSASF